jgi:ferredoxin
MEALTLFRKCDGCNDCELACSFRATGTFWRPASAIRIRKQTTGITAKYRIQVDRTDCDLCAGEKIPQCQVVCRSGVLNPETLRYLREQSVSSTMM